MRYGLAGLGVFALLCAAPGRATDWDSVAGWDVYEIDARRCVIGRVFPEAGGTTFGILMSLDGETRIFVTSPGWAMRAGQAIDTEVGLDGKVVIAGPSVAIEQRENRGFVAAAASDFLDRFAAAKQLSVRVGAWARGDRLPLTGSAAGLAQGRRCLANLRSEGSQAPAPRIATRAAPEPVRTYARAPTQLALAALPQTRLALASKAVPRGRKSSWVDANDYPDAALRAEEQGTVTVKLAIGPRGGVEACDVVRSSGSSALDGTTCRVIQRRARYTPAFDTSGRPVASIDQHTVRWSLPE